MVWGFDLHLRRSAAILGPKWFTQRRTVLVVEDNAIIGMLLAEVLAGMGHDVCAIEATESDAATAAVRCRPDLMIVDVQLGDGSGVSAVEKYSSLDSSPTCSSAVIR
jgi:DNA-binding response OmpR family regulator